MYVHPPNEIRTEIGSTFPNHRCVRMAMRQEKGTVVYRGTVFDPACGTARTQLVGDETVSNRCSTTWRCLPTQG